MISRKLYAYIFSILFHLFILVFFIVLPPGNSETREITEKFITLTLSAPFSGSGNPESHKNSNSDKKKSVSENREAGEQKNISSPQPDGESIDDKNSADASGTLSSEQVYSFLNSSASSPENSGKNGTVSDPLILNRDSLFRYSKEALKLKLEGEVFLQLNVNEQGTVKDVVILKSSGSAILDQLAYKDAFLLLFEPKKINGKPVPFVFILKIIYTLGE